MSAWKVEFSKLAAKQIKKLDRFTASVIMAWIGKHLIGSENPRIHGKPRKGNLSGIWRYRIGDYRLLAELYDDVVTVQILTVEHRREIYNDSIETRTS